MTIGIGVALPDGALLVADGRQAYPESPDKEPNDNVDKIKNIKRSVFAIYVGHNVGGGAIADNLAIETLKDEGDLHYKPEKWKDHIRTALEINWSKMANIKIDHQKKRAGLIVGGVSNSEPFVIGSLRTPQKSTNDPKLMKSGFISLGGEEQGASELFVDALRGIIVPTQWDESTRKNDAICNILDEIKDVIKTVASQNVSIGGTVRYIIVREGFSNDKGKLAKF